MTHTPGPWTIIKPNVAPDFEICARGGRSIAVAFSNSIDGEANAHLIAAAPDMLAALREALLLFDEDTTISAKIEAAISKATGK